MAYDGRDRILLRFDLAASIPQEAVVTEASLELYASYSEYPAVTTDVGVYEVLRLWTESGATWTHATADATWQEAGCQGSADRSSEYLGLASLDTTSPWQLWGDTQLTSLVQRWVSDPVHNYGVVLLSLPLQEYQFWTMYSSQMGSGSEPLRPRLTVSYYIPVPSPTPSLTNTPVPSATPVATETATPIVSAAVVSGAAWRDDNRNGQVDSGEPPMPGVTVILKDSGYVELNRRVTIGDGSYEFSDLTHGSYVLTKEDLVGWSSTWPSGGVYAFYLADGQRLTGMNFGFSAAITPTPTTAPTHSATPTATPTATATTTLMWTPTQTPIGTISPTAQASVTATRTPTLVRTSTPTTSPTPTSTPIGNLQDPVPIVCQETYSGNTTGRPSMIGDYGACGASGWWGPEIVYRFEAGYALDSLGISLNTTADVYLLMLSSDNPASCLAWGRSVGVQSVAAGVTYYVVVDGSEPGDYTMTVYCYPPPVTTPTATRTATATGGPSPTPTKTATPGGPSRIYLPIIDKPRLEFLVDCGAAANYLDPSTAELWLADRVYTAGGWGYVGYANAWSTNRDIVGGPPSMMPLYQTVRYGYAFGYQFEVPSGNYDVDLHFAEIFHDKAGRRVFDVILEGQTVLEDLDIFAATGGQLRSLVRSFVVTVNDGQLDLVLDSVVDLAMINAIRVTKQ